jgi:hypothetical protein
MTSNEGNAAEKSRWVEVSDGSSKSDSLAEIQFSRSENIQNAGVTPCRRSMHSIRKGAGIPRAWAACCAPVP